MCRGGVRVVRKGALVVGRELLLVGATGAAGGLPQMSPPTRRPEHSHLIGWQLTLLCCVGGGIPLHIAEGRCHAASDGGGTSSDTGETREVTTRLGGQKRVSEQGTKDSRP